MTMYTYDITHIFWLIISLTGAIITTFVIPYIKSKTTAQHQETIRNLATVAVYAAQQLFQDNTAKRAYALQRVSEGLNRYGIKLTEEEIRSYVEGALKDIKTSLAEDDKTW